MQWAPGQMIHSVEKLETIHIQYTVLSKYGLNTSTEKGEYCAIYIQKLVLTLSDKSHNKQTNKQKQIRIPSFFLA